MFFGWWCPSVPFSLGVYIVCLIHLYLCQEKMRGHVNLYHWNSVEMAEDVSKERTVDLLFIVVDFQVKFNVEAERCEMYIHGRIAQNQTIHVYLDAYDSPSECKLQRLLSVRGLIAYVRGIYAVISRSTDKIANEFYMRVPRNGMPNRLILFCRFSHKYFTDGSLPILQNVSVMNDAIRKKNRGTIFPLLRPERAALNDLIRHFYCKKTKTLRLWLCPFSTLFIAPFLTKFFCLKQCCSTFRLYIWTVTNITHTRASYLVQNVAVFSFTVHQYWIHDTSCCLHLKSLFYYSRSSEGAKVRLKSAQKFKHHIELMFNLVTYAWARPRWVISSRMPIAIAISCSCVIGVLDARTTCSTRSRNSPTFILVRIRLYCDNKCALGTCAVWVRPAFICFNNASRRSHVS